MKQWQRREICAAIPARHFLFCPVQRFFNPAKSLHATPSKYGRSPVHLPRRLQSPGCSGGYGGQRSERQGFTASYNFLLISRGTFIPLSSAKSPGRRIRTSQCNRRLYREWSFGSFF